MGKARDGRMFQPRLEVLERRTDAGVIELLAPAVGYWRGGPRPGDLIGPGEDIGELEVLGQLQRLVAPKAAGGSVLELPGRSPVAPVAVEFRAVLLRLDPKATPATAVADEAESATSTGMVFRAPLSGRFYGRPTPTQPAFVKPGDVIKSGQTVALLEVMKTFNRVVYGAPDLPNEAKVKRIVPDDESDLDEGAPILELEPV